MFLRAFAAIKPGQKVKTGQPQRPRPRRFGVGRIGAGDQHGVIQAGQGRGEVVGHRLQQPFLGGVDGGGVGCHSGIGQGLRHVIFGRQAQSEGAKGGVKAFIARHLFQRGHIGGAGGGVFGDHAGQHILGQRPPRFPFIERVGVMGEQKGAILGGCGAVQHHRGGEAAQ